MYGDAENREWKQYFLPDDNDPVRGACPFLSRRASTKKKVHFTEAVIIGDETQDSNPELAREKCQND
jgi:hypothetical protein